MVANLENTVRKWKAVGNAIYRAQGGPPSFWGFRGARYVIHKNAPAYRNVFRNYEKALGNQNNITTLQVARNYFGNNPNKRQYITAAYNKLPNLHKQLNTVAHKIVTVRKLQKIRRSAVQERNKKEKNAKMLLAGYAVKNLPKNMATREILSKVYANLHRSKTPYGPLTESNTLRRIFSRKYNTY
jgi:hypothetical protein